MYLGVPYATPPTGSNRFSPTRTAAPWDGIKLCDKFGPVCPQKLPDIRNETAALERMPRGRLEYLKRLLPFLQNQSEDCLYLNIYAPAQGMLNTQVHSLVRSFVQVGTFNGIIQLPEIYRISCEKIIHSLNLN